LVDAQDLIASAFKVNTERGTVYVMGRVTSAKANRATESRHPHRSVSASSLVFEIISEDELARMLPTPAAAPSQEVSQHLGCEGRRQRGRSAY